MGKVTQIEVSSIIKSAELTGRIKKKNSNKFGKPINLRKDGKKWTENSQLMQNTEEQ